MVDLDEFKQNWLRRCEELKKQALTKEQCGTISLRFDNEKTIYLMSIPESEHTLEFMSYFEDLESDLEIALKIAESNYEKQKKPFLEKIVLKIDSIIKLGK